MKKSSRILDASQKNVVMLLDGLTGRYNRWQLWQDFVILSAISIANVFDQPRRKEWEEEYRSRAGKYSEKELEAFGTMLYEVTTALEANPDQDFLGELFMALGLGNEWAGQFFTPYDICRAMAEITCREELKGKIEKAGWVAANDPACGAGALLIALANECRRPGMDINYQTSVLFTAQDIDFLAGCMCYIQLSLLGCPGYVVIGNTLTQPAVCVDARGLIPADGQTVLYTPMYFRDVWQWRRVFAAADLMMRRDTARDAEMQEKLRRANAVPLDEAENGQLTFF